jgi:hypothetical protein
LDGAGCATRMRGWVWEEWWSLWQDPSRPLDLCERIRSHRF